MKNKKLYKISEILESEIISAAYNDASIITRLKIFYLRKKYKEVDKLYNEYRSTYNKVHSIEKPVLSEEFSERILNIAEENKSSLLETLYYAFFKKPVFYMAFAVLISVFLIKAPFSDNAEYSTEELNQIRKANQQVMMSLSIIGKAFNSTKITLEKEILAKKVGMPIKNSLKIVNNLFTEE